MKRLRVLRHHAPQVGDTMEESQASESATNGGASAAPLEYEEAHKTAVRL